MTKPQKKDKDKAVQFSVRLRSRHFEQLEEINTILGMTDSEAVRLGISMVYKYALERKENQKCSKCVQSAINAL